MREVFPAETVPRVMSFMSLKGWLEKDWVRCFLFLYIPYDIQI